MHLRVGQSAPLCFSSASLLLRICLFCQGMGEPFNNHAAVKAAVELMGMGEPFNNHAAVKAAVELMVAPYGFHMSPNHITVSTVGVVPHIRSFASAFPSLNQVPVFPPLPKLPSAPPHQVGVVPHIRSFATAFPSVNLALSLHAPSQPLRISIVPSARAYSLEKLMQAVDEYQQQRYGEGNPVQCRE
ncbi:unnamed protein product [Closterium sp. Naga37s-1]|nr:unnamed protein product [Closterium sp. Naga37s-1]